MWWIYPVLDSEATGLVQCEESCITNDLAVPTLLWKTVSLRLGSPYSGASWAFIFSAVT